MTTFDTTLGARIRRYRILRGLTQQKLADAVGVSFQQVQKYERGVNRVSAEMLVTVATALEVEPMQLLRDGPQGQQAPVPLGRMDTALFAALGKCTDMQKHAIRQLVEAFAGGGDRKEAA